MPVFQVEHSKEFAAWLSNGIDGAAKRAITSAAARVVSHIANELVPNEDPQPVDTGAYRAGWHAEQTDKGADVVNTLPYASIIEGGARAENIKIGKKMIEALTKWVQRKGFGSYAYKTKSGRVRTVKLPSEQAESIAWAIATAMKKRGIFNRGNKKGLRIAERAAKFAAMVLPEEMAHEVQRALR